MPVNIFRASLETFASQPGKNYSSVSHRCRVFRKFSTFSSPAINPLLFVPTLGRSVSRRRAFLDLLSLRSLLIFHLRFFSTAMLLQGFVHPFRELSSSLVFSKILSLLAASFSIPRVAFPERDLETVSLLSRISLLLPLPPSTVFPFSRTFCLEPLSAPPSSPLLCCLRARGVHSF